MTKNEIPWINCVEFDNASVNIGTIPLKQECWKKNPKFISWGVHVIFFTTLHVQLVQDSVQLQGLM